MIIVIQALLEELANLCRMNLKSLAQTLEDLRTIYRTKK